MNTEAATSSDVMASDQVAAAAARLSGSARSRTPCEPVRDLIGSDLDAAYSVQRVLIGERQAAGASVIGHKIGLTAASVQAQLGVEQPDFGMLLDDMLIPAGGTVPAGVLLQPKVEAEIAFLLGADLIDGPLDRAQVSQAVDHAVAALEIVDSRVRDWDITITDTVADNASCGLFVLSEQQVPLDSFAPADVGMQLWMDGRVVSRGTGTDCLGDPLNALVWLARTARNYGRPLRAGDTILSGSLGPMVNVHPGSSVRAEFTDLGGVEVTFAALEDS